MDDKKERFKVRNVGGWQRLQNDCRGLEISNEALIKEFAHAFDGGEATQEKYALMLYEFAEWLSEQWNVPLLGAKKAHVHRFIHIYLKSDARAERDAKREEPCGWKGALSPSSRKGFLAAIRELWRHCATLDYTECDPTLGVETPTVKNEPGLTLSDDQVRRFLDARGRERDRVQAHLLVYTAARSSAIRLLLWEDIDFPSKQIRFREKFGKVTHIPMHHELYSALKRWQEAQRREAEKHPKLAEALKDTERAFVLLTPTGKPLAHSTIGKQVKFRANRCGIARHTPSAKVGKENKSKLHPHALRRSWATIQLNKGEPLEDIADMLGHKSIETTRKHYAFSSNARRRRIANAFNV